MVVNKYINLAAKTSVIWHGELSLAMV